ncbi:hypothetical protein [Flavobacterium sp. XGLA_31]|uniref:hypothetical protein n=1 Tax=Flavobacterium sp. XGLA_31 TaxID=3447666 RepID=UPI003F31303A
MEPRQVIHTLPYISESGLIKFINSYSETTDDPYLHQKIDIILPEKAFLLPCVLLIRKGGAVDVPNIEISTDHLNNNEFTYYKLFKEVNSNAQYPIQPSHFRNAGETVYLFEFTP